MPSVGGEEGSSDADLIGASKRKSKANLINLTTSNADKRLSSIRRPTVKPLGRGMTLMEKENGELEIKINTKSPVESENSLLSPGFVSETIPLSLGDGCASPLTGSNTNSLARLMTTSRSSLHRLNTTKTISTSSINKQAVI